MEIVRGRSVLKRTAVGRLQYYEKEEPRITQGALPKDQLKKAIDEFLLKQNNEAK